MKKRLFMLFALALVLCVGMAMLCTSCASDSAPEPDAVFSGVESDPPQREPIPTPTIAPAQEADKTSTLEPPDLYGVIREVGQDSFTVMPIRVQSSGNESVAAAGAAPSEEITVQISDAVLETVTVYDGGSGEPQPADADALAPDLSVYLYGKKTEDGFTAEKVLILKTEAEVS